jgi:hypothetical protein
MPISPASACGHRPTLRASLVVAILFGLPLCGYANNAALSGRVVDVSQRGVAGASVIFPADTSPDTTSVNLQLTPFGGPTQTAGNLSFGKSLANQQRQWNLVQTVSWLLAAHDLKFGIDYRRLSPVATSASAGFRTTSVAAWPRRLRVVVSPPSRCRRWRRPATSASTTSRSSLRTPGARPRSSP